MPSVPVAILAAVLVNILYSLVPAGRLRERAELVVVAVLGVTVVSRLYLAQEGLWDAVMGIVVGVAIPLAAFRLFAPNEDLSGHRRRAAHLDVTGVRGEAIAGALEDQLGIVPAAVTPFNLAGSGVPRRCGSR